MSIISTKEAAEILGISVRRVQVLIKEGRLPAREIGGTFVIEEKNLKLVQERKPGRPKKKKT